MPDPKKKSYPAKFKSASPSRGRDIPLPETGKNAFNMPSPGGPVFGNTPAPQAANWEQRALARDRVKGVRNEALKISKRDGVSFEKAYRGLNPGNWAEDPNYKRFTPSGVAKRAAYKKMSHAANPRRYR